MRKRSKKLIEYIKDYQKHGEILMPNYSKKLTVVNFTRRYHNTIHILANLTGKERLVLDYLTEIMDEENKVFSNAKSRQDLISFISYVTKGELVMSDNSVKMYLMNLTKHGLVLPSGSRGTAYVNPEYFFSGTEDERLRLIKKLLEEKIMLHEPKKKELEEHPMNEPAAMESSHKIAQDNSMTQEQLKSYLEMIDKF